MEDLVNYTIAITLRKKGFDEPCEWTFYNNYRVRDEIYEKHPGLSDDGYEDLSKKYGGPYRDDELYGYYVEPLRLYSRNSTIGINPITKKKVETSKLCSCPDINQVLKWLRKEKKLHIVIELSDKNTYCWYIQMVGKRISKLSSHLDNYYDQWEETALAAIKYAIFNLI